MTQQDVRQDFGQATVRVASALAMERDQIRFRPDQTPCPGDTFVHRATEHPVEWLIVERDPADVQRLLVIPVDDYPQVGSHDLQLHPGGEQVANARCGLGTWLDVATFGQELRTGYLQPPALARIGEKRAEIAEPTFAASLLGEEVDGDPEYRHWLQETQLAVTALQTVTTTRAPARKTRSRWWSSSSGPLAVAASVLLLIAVASTWKVREVRQHLVAQQQQTASLREDRDAIEQSLNDSRTQIKTLRDKVTSIEQESARSVDQLKQQLNATQMRAVEQNIAFAFLPSEESSSRGRPYSLSIEAEARRVALFVPVVDPEWYSTYRLDLVDRQTKTAVWSADHFVLTQAVLTVSLPATLFDTGGEYEIRLAGMTDEGPKLLEERYLIEVEVSRE